MPTYDYRCEKCGNEFEEFLPMAKRAEPTEVPCKKQLHQTSPFPICGGKITQVPGLTSFAYDNIASPGHPKKPPGWMTDKLKEIKKKQVKSTMSWHH
ncbi:uncharacterized protein METZ01_LOCUS364248 [marine metagenome]|uniref:Putative regulatory protein FmdB zinc ribbon domain-containing protein n=1 Tax=marine metagenome TaxID=408172 RepID=A0A382SNA4_9ZZZZ